MIKPSDSVLYFPTIEFQNEDWVKSSLLFWDKVYRIVPKDYTPIDSKAIIEAQENDLIRNITLESQDVSITGEKFLRFCDQLPFIPAGLDVKDYHRIHPDKIDKRLYPSLENIANKFQEDEFLKLSPELARGYMFHLSKVVAERRDLVRATDNRDSWTISPYFIEEANFGEHVYNCNADGYYCSLIINDLLPANLSVVPMTKIVDFVNKRRDLKENFRNNLNEFVNNLSRCESVEHTKALINDYKKSIESSKKELRKSMGFCNSDDISSLLTIGVPVSLTAFSAFAVSGDPFDLHNILSSILVGAVAAYSDYKKAKKRQRTNSHLSYLIDMDNKFAAKKVYPRYSYIFQEFIND